MQFSVVSFDFEDSYQPGDLFGMPLQNRAGCEALSEKQRDHNSTIIGKYSLLAWRFGPAEFDFCYLKYAI
jgi:hypothetical protein